MRTTACVRLLALAAVVACARPEEAPAQSESPASKFARSRDASVRAAVAMIESGRPWRATEIIDSAFRGSPSRSPEVTVVAALAAVAWGGWARVDKELTNAPWVDSLFDGQGRELLARAALARGADSVARGHAERALRVARTDRDRGVREVLLARALDRQAVGDSAASMYRRAASHLPWVAEWLELRAAGATADASERQRSYARVSGTVARSRIAPTEAQARERWRDLAGAARAYAAMGDTAPSLRLRLLASPDSATRADVRVRAFALLKSESAPQVRIAIALVDSSLSPLSANEDLAVARAASAAGLFARAVAGFARTERDLDAQDRYAYGAALTRVGRDADAVTQFGRIPATGSLGPLAAYQRARALLRAGQSSAARAALHRVAQAFPRDSGAAAPALFLLADLATDDGRDAEARSGFLDVARRFPAHDLAPVCLFRAATIAYAAGTVEAAARDFASLIERYPRSSDVTAARYWAARSKERTGDRKGAADRFREVIATDPLSYYAMKSASRLGIPAWKPTQAVDSVALTPALARAVARASLLDALGMNTEEGFEYDGIALVESNSADSLLAAGDALARRGEVSRAIALARRALAASSPRDTRLFHLLYPVAYGDVIRAEATSHRVDPALAAALIHQESSFNTRATSRAGAVGLMQVLPSVGATIAKSEGIASFERVLLYQPDVNVRLGMAHLRAMVTQYPRIEYALAAYNAGGSPVRRWRQKAGSDDPELFVERIPYDETRDYVRILLRNQATYKALYGW